MDVRQSGRHLDRLEDRGVAVRLVGGFSRKEQQAGFVLFPVHSQLAEQPWRQRNLPLLGSLAEHHANLHPLGVDVVDHQVGRFGEPHPGGVEGGQEDTLLELLGALQ